MTKDGRRDKRIPIGLKVRFKSATIAEFIEQYSRDLSRGGIFVRAQNPMPIGTLIKFDICLNDEKSLIQGVGRVVWRREEGTGEENPAGMGIKFIKLDESSRANLDVILVDGTVAEGKPPAEAPLIVEVQVEEGEAPPPQPIAPVRPQSVPKGAKRTMIGMGPTSRPAPAPAPADAASPSDDPARAQSFLADISSAIDDALGDRESSESIPPSETAGEAGAEAAGEAASEAATGPAEPTPETGGELSAEEKPGGEPAPSDDAAPESKPVEAAQEKTEETPEEKVAEKPVDKPAEKPAEKPADVPEEKEATRPVVLKDEGKQKVEKPAETAVRIGSDAKERGGIPAVVWLILIAGIAGAIYYFGFYQGDQGDGGAQREVVEKKPVAPKSEPKPEPVEPVAAPPQPEPPAPAGKIEIATVPPGATVTIDGAAREGTTPLVIEGLVPQKEIAVEATVFGFAPASQKVVPGDGEPVKVEMKLAPAKIEIEIKTEPAGASIQIGDKASGRTPRKIAVKNVKEPLSYTLSKDGYDEATGSISASDFSFVDGSYKALIEVSLAKIQKPVEPPKAEEPKAEKPKTEKPKAEKPKAEAPKAEEPKAEKPKAEEPKAEKPKAEEPKAEKPKAEKPKAEEPKAVDDNPY